MSSNKFNLVFTVTFTALILQDVICTSLDGCPAVDPNCHPWCIKYDAAHCRHCRCSSMGYGPSTSIGDGWNAEFDSGSGNSWSSGSGSSGNSWSGNSGDTWSSSSSRDNSEVQIVYVEKQRPTYDRYKETYPDVPASYPEPFRGGNSMSAGFPSPFNGGNHQGPSPDSILMPNSVPGYTIPDGYTVEHVKVRPIGIPVHCVRGPIVCPNTCIRIDHWGCKSCPCLSANAQTIGVLVKAREPVHRDKCMQTVLCMLSCKDGYELGDRGQDGCQSCICKRKHSKTPPSTTTAPTSALKTDCLDVVKCMLSCKHGYTIGTTQANGCQSCHCNKGDNSSKTSSPGAWPNGGHANTAAGGTNTGNTGGGGSTSGGNSNAWKNGGGGTTSGGSGNTWKTGIGSVLGNTNNGVSGGKCEPPMCLSGHMSVTDAMKIGSASAGGGLTGMTGSGSSGSGCHPPMCMTGDKQGTSSSGTSVGSGMTAGGSSGSCSGPFCANMGGMGSGGSGGGMGMGGGMTSGSGGGMGMGGGSSGGCSGPFCAGMGGGGGGMTSGGGMSSSGGSGGAVKPPFSPFAAAAGLGPGAGMSAGGGGGMGMRMGMGAGARGGTRQSVGGDGGTGLPGMGGPIPANSGALTDVVAHAYNADCTGSECSSKGGKEIECMDLLKCMVTCDGNYFLGSIDKHGCQICTCKGI